MQRLLLLKCRSYEEVERYMRLSQEGERSGEGYRGRDTDLSDGSLDRISESSFVCSRAWWH